MKENIIEQTRIKKASLLKKILLSGGEIANVLKISYLMGVGFGATGRITGEKWIPAIPPMIDLIGGAMPTPERMVCYTAYGTGIATVYADKIYEYIKPLLE